MTTPEQCSGGTTGERHGECQNLPIDATLAQLLEIVLPEGIQFKLYHISTPPERCEALTTPAPGHRPERTYRESHFLGVTIQSDRGQVLAFALEVFIYSTATISTFFVSKADSTGYLGLVNCPKGMSPIKDVSGTFISHLVALHQRYVPHVVSLFARAQDQYLFPGSIENAGKHVLDDRGLVRWWCRVLDSTVDCEFPKLTMEAHLLVPGLDKYETMTLLPSNKDRWTIGHPLESIYGTELPPRCVVPRFPDDPKARYLGELDEEVQDAKYGMWKSIKTLAQFWDMMAFRQECSAGRMVGFIWVVFTPLNSPIAERLQPPFYRVEGVKPETRGSQTILASGVADTPDVSRPEDGPGPPLSNRSIPISPIVTNQTSRNSKDKSQGNKLKKTLQGPIYSRNPRIKTATESSENSFKIPRRTPYYCWPEAEPGDCVVQGKDYKRITELLLRLDFSDLSLAVSSTSRWIGEVSTSWGIEVTGQRVWSPTAQIVPGPVPLTSGLMKKKRKVDSETAGVNVPQINILGSSFIRKKVKKT